MIPSPPIGSFEIAGSKPFRVEYPYGRPGDGFRRLANPSKATCVSYHRDVHPRELAGLRAGNPYRYGTHDDRYVAMVDDMRHNGFRGGDGQRIIVHVTLDDAWVAEGNHRVRAAQAAGLESVELEIRYLGNADESRLLIPFDPNDPDIRIVSE